MDNGIIKSVILPAVIIIAGFPAVFALSGFVNNSRPQLPQDYGDSDLMIHSSSLKGYAFGTEGLIADYYFMRSLQYIGDKIDKSQSDFINIDDLRDLNPRLLYPMLENATDLDPHFIAAYTYGAIVLPAINTDHAIALASKGIANNPDSWRLYQHIAYIYWRLKKYDKAAEFYEKGSAIQGSSPFMKMMSASMKLEGGSRDTARIIYREMLASSEDEQVKNTAEAHLKELDSLDERDVIDKVLADFKQNTGRCVNNFSELTSMLMRVKQPENAEFHVNNAGSLVDPTGVPYLLDKEKCTVMIDRGKNDVPVK